MSALTDTGAWLSRPGRAECPGGPRQRRHPHAQGTHVPPSSFQLLALFRPLRLVGCGPRALLRPGLGYSRLPALVSVLPPWTLQHGQVKALTHLKSDFPVCTSLTAAGQRSLLSHTLVWLDWSTQLVLDCLPVLTSVAFSFFLLLLPYLAACRIFPGSEPMPPAVEARSPNHRTSRSP